VCALASRGGAAGEGILHLRNPRPQEVAGYFQSFLAIRGEKASLRNDIPDEI
jgi:hypothetical protein